MGSAIALNRSRGFIYDSLKRHRRKLGNAEWVAYGAELCRCRLRAGWSLTELGQHINLSATTLRYIEQAYGSLRPPALTIDELVVALGTPSPQGTDMEPSRAVSIIQSAPKNPAKSAVSPSR